jgi:hypothetical protein
MRPATGGGRRWQPEPDEEAERRRGADRPARVAAFSARAD